ncbi:hypothetical protein ANO11243_096220 [Dothideomycetidae sp. 11243]|nr:hypothetical protein ANO11243_096220 [fungal sp. No.11243]
MDVLYLVPDEINSFEAVQALSLPHNSQHVKRIPSQDEQWPLGRPAEYPSICIPVPQQSIHHSLRWRFVVSSNPAGADVHLPVTVGIAPINVVFGYGTPFDDSFDVPALYMRETLGDAGAHVGVIDPISDEKRQKTRETTWEKWREAQELELVVGATRVIQNAIYLMFGPYRFFVFQPIRSLGEVSILQKIQARQRSEVAESEWREVRMLGKGGYGEVWLVRGMRTGAHRAIKTTASKAEDVKRLIKREVSTTQKLKHDITLECQLLLEPCHGSLLDLMLEDNVSRHLPALAQHISSTLAYIHGKNIIHRDIDNILFRIPGVGAHGFDNPYDEAGPVVFLLSDFGLAADHTADCASEQGVEPFTAPEMRAGHRYSKKVDIYSFGITLAQALHHTRPLPHPELSTIPHETQMTRGAEIEGVIDDWARKMRNDDPALRPTAGQLVKAFQRLQWFASEDEIAAEMAMRPLRRPGQQVAEHVDEEDWGQLSHESYQGGEGYDATQDQISNRARSARDRSYARPSTRLRDPVPGFDVYDPAQQERLMRAYVPASMALTLTEAARMVHDHMAVVIDDALRPSAAGESEPRETEIEQLEFMAEEEDMEELSDEEELMGSRRDKRSVHAFGRFEG